MRHSVENPGPLLLNNKEALLELSRMLALCKAGERLGSLGLNKPSQIQYDAMREAFDKLKGEKKPELPSARFHNVCWYACLG